MTTPTDDLITTTEWAQRYSWEDDFEDIMRCARRLAAAYPDIAFHLSAIGFRKALAITDAGYGMRMTTNRQIAVVWPDGADLPSFVPYDPDQRDGVLFAFDTAYPFEGELGAHPSATSGGSSPSLRATTLTRTTACWPRPPPAWRRCASAAAMTA